MPDVEVVFYRETDGDVPMILWLDGLNDRSQNKCFGVISWLAKLGHELRRPHADYVGAGIYELRVKDGRSNHRMLYFFHARSVVVMTHGFMKQQSQIPLLEIRRALGRKKEFEANPGIHSFSWR